jgi:hypothetical protein
MGAPDLEYPCFDSSCRYVHTGPQAQVENEIAPRLGADQVALGQLQEKKKKNKKKTKTGHHHIIRYKRLPMISIFPDTRVWALLIALRVTNYHTQPYGPHSIEAFAGLTDSSCRRLAE